MVQSPEPSSLKRRELLGVAGTAGLAATSGCMRRLRSITGWQSRSQVSMGIRAVPADADPYAFRIARSLAEWFQAAGIDASVEPLSEEQLLRSVLLDHDFEVFVGQLSPGVQDPDGLYSYCIPDTSTRQAGRIPSGTRTSPSTRTSKPSARRKTTLAERSRRPSRRRSLEPSRSRRSRSPRTPGRPGERDSRTGAPARSIRRSGTSNSNGRRTARRTRPRNRRFAES